MPNTVKLTKVKEDGEEKNAIQFTFTNGAKEQIEELKEFWKLKNEKEVIEAGISLLEKLKRQKND